MPDSSRRPILRPARLPDDAPFILELLVEFHAKHGIACGDIPIDPVSIALTVQSAVANGICLVGPTSCAAARITPFPWNHRVKLAQVSFWYFRNPREIVIFDAMMVACKAAGATHISACSHYPLNRVARFYEGKGLQLSESICIGSL